MTKLIDRAVARLRSTILRHTPGRQVAALCYRQKGDEKQVLLVTSRDTGRWIVPKGWHEDGMTPSQAAAQEAWEEAGVRKGNIQDEPLGSYDYLKRLDNGDDRPIEAEVFPLEVTKLKEEFPEAHQRRRKWVSPAKAATMVREPGLRRILKRFEGA